ncbi:MAG: aminotransferase class I/II-fold pyridoxal phosphate-dependent enzyme [Acidobacteria bacterium]|nr:aminotransferase class I/II-fold pyridoxal phosphate-dependent enzyme [Acidobacteriota bacterium]
MTTKSIGSEPIANNGVDFVRKAIRAISAYTLEPRIAPDKLDQNEGALDFPDALKREVVTRIMRRRWNVYPDFEAVELRDAIARRGGIARENVLVGNGSNELLMVAMATLVAPGRRVVVPTPTFPLYEKLATIFGGEVVPVDVDPHSGALPVEAMIGAASGPDPALVVACSPNNPTGGVLSLGDLDALLGSGAFVLLDRAYGEFWDDGSPRPVDRLVTLSTFSKAWGLASLRIGWLESTPELCSEMRKVKLPYNLNVFSLEAALVAIENEALMRARVADTIRERAKVAAALAALPGVEVFPTQSNFVAFRVEGSADALFEQLIARGTLVRNISRYLRLERCLRVSIGEPAENDRFLASIAALLGAESAVQSKGEGA